jgi:hypothetical protein
VTIPHILAELDDLEKFNHVRELVAFIGLVPKETLSGSSIKGKPRLCKIGHARAHNPRRAPQSLSCSCCCPLPAAGRSADDRDSIDFNEHPGIHQTGNLDHRGGRRVRREILSTDRVNILEIRSADVVFDKYAD